MLGQVQPAIDQGSSGAGGVGQEDADLAVLDPARGTRILVLKGRDDIETLDARAYLSEVGGLGVGSYVQLLPHRHNTHAISWHFSRKGSSAGGALALTGVCL
ncbi:hypothetical protein GCM10018965_040020 [Nonomuraea roseola]